MKIVNKELLIKPHIFVVDYNMPKKNGIKLLIELLKVKSPSKFILISGEQNIKTITSEIKEMITLQKPFKFNDLLNSIDEVILSYPRLDAQQQIIKNYSP